MQHQEFELKGSLFKLLPQKALYWPSQDALVIADFHLGKASHFRKSGIPVPFSVFNKNVEGFIKLLQWHKPKLVIFLGDLFHSVHNREWQYFSDILTQFPNTDFTLIKGNHDIMEDSVFSRSGMEVIDRLELENCLLTHEPVEEDVDDKVNLCGHIHPGVVMRGKARQGVKLPCFYFNGKHFILPAFGEFTGTYKMKPETHHRIFVIAENQVISVN